MMKPKWLLLCVLIIGLISASVQAQENTSEEAQPHDPVTIKWYVGLGTGATAEQLETEDRLVDAFNTSQDDIILELVCVCGGQTPYDWFSIMVDSGVPLDIIGPLGFGGANRFTETGWLDLQPLIESHGYDLSQFPPNMVETYRTSGGELSALPFAIYPGVLYYNADLFDAAGLHYPPTRSGEAYIMPDGSRLPWDYETVALIGRLLTLDANGHDATHPDFDPTSIVQFGFTHQWDSMRSDFHTFGSAHVVNENGQVIIPEHWRAQAHWFWGGVWENHFIPSNAYVMSDLFRNNNAFASGHVAMARSMVWYTCCLSNLDVRWDIAVQPAYRGAIYAPMDFDSFYIHASTLYPEESFIVLQYLLGAAAPDLLDIYGAFPARPDLQEVGLHWYQEHYPTVQNWDVFSTSTQFIPAVHHESTYPNYDAGEERFNQFLTMLLGENSATIDLDAELDKLESDLQAIVDGEARP